MQKINFEDEPNTNTPIDADNLNLLQDNVEEAIDEVQSNLDTANTYSLEETRIGIWFGKPLYRKVIARNQIVTNGINISLPNLNIDELVKIDGKHINNSNVFTNNFFDSSDLKITLHGNNNNIVVWAETGQEYTSTIWIEYTKTTDEVSEVSA